MKNKLADLNNHLFAQLERLSDEGIKDNDLKEEIARTEAIVKISDQIVHNADINLKAAKLIADHGISVAKNLPLISNREFVAKPNLVKAAGDQS